MGVYNTNSYNPLGSIQAALNNVNERNRIKNEYWKNKGQIWSNFANQMGQIGGRLTDALTSDYDRNDPNADAGWASYIISGDRGILDSYQNREAQKEQLLKQQEFQAAEAALARKFQEQENERNRQNAQAIAGMNKQTALEDKRDDAKLRLEKLAIAKSEAERVGGDTRQLDAEIKYLTDKYKFEQPSSEPYDPRNNVDYVLAKHSEVGKDNDLASIDAAIAEVSKYQTPAAAKRLAELDKIKEARVKYEDALAHEKDLVAAWNGGELSDGLTNLGYTAELAGNYIRLKNKNGKLIKRIRIKGSSNNSNNDWNL